MQKKSKKQKKNKPLKTRSEASRQKYIKILFDAKLRFALIQEMRFFKKKAKKKNYKSMQKTSKKNKPIWK